jgi:N6-adenosine-specific RNA methylase IME4
MMGVLNGIQASAILVDAPVRFETWSDKGKGRSAERHYRVMDWDRLIALDVNSIAAPDCALFLWATYPSLPRYFELIKAWGFQYKTVGFVWVKGDAPALAQSALPKKLRRPVPETYTHLFTGNGYWTRANSELCLLASRGKRQRLHADVHQIIIAPRRQHSRKPDEIYTRIERLVPGPYVELFARQQWPGWICVGDESGKFPAEAA